MSIIEEDKKKEIVDVLYWDSRVDASDIAVMVEDSKATLAGRVPSFWAREVAEENAWSVKGILSVNNQLTVNYPVPVPTDAELKLNIDTLLHNSVIDASKISVSVDAGIITLKGTVDTFWQSWRVENMVKDVNGALDVVNELTVVPTESPLDEEIAQRIVQAFKSSILIDPDAVTVKVDTGEVTLTGVLPSRYTRMRAEELAASTLGVISVNNRIDVT
jgi:osmotically-inducible protein OsmY